MPPVFGRDFPDPHPYDNALKTWLASGDTFLQSMARNVMHDRRVSKEREDVFDHFVDKPCAARALNRAIVDYFIEKVRRRKRPHYVYKAINQRNLLTGRGLMPLIHKDVRLVRILDLNGLSLVYQWANDPIRRKRLWEATLQSLPTSLTDSTVAKWLNDEIEGKSSSEIERTVSTILDIMNSYSQEEAYQPTWATTWAAFEPHEKDGPERWLQVLGMTKPPPRWVILLSYTVAEAGTLAGPTTLDAGWNAYHFPAPMAAGGHPMDLRISPRSTFVLPEFLHKQIRHPLAHWLDLGGKIGRTVAANATVLADQRRAHFDLLVRVYGSGVRSWMKSPL